MLKVRLKPGISGPVQISLLSAPQQQLRDVGYGINTLNATEILSSSSALG